MRITLKPNAAGLSRLREITNAPNIPMSDPLFLSRLGAVHRDQMLEVFETEGGTAKGGGWSPLNPRYAARKRKYVGGKKILQLTTDMMRRFIYKGSHGYIEEYLPTSATHGLFRFGALSDVAAAHRHGNPALASRQSAIARKVFGGRAPRLPKRDMITKTARHLSEMRRVLRETYLVRLRQILKGQERLGAPR